ncbi:MAG TPA: sulfotransferase [Solirubrobacteraceae bacterium]|nr:sulfotransferase [Solirubrobacteraceae bacterium]
MSAEPLCAQAGQGARLPDFFIVGHAKSGTTALYEMLRGHPQVYMPALKEPWFFASDMRPRFIPVRAGPSPQTLEEYRALFKDAGPDQRIGEASSSYLWSRTAAAAIAQAAPQARIIAILREPASFLRSLHLQLLQSHVEVRKDFRTAIELEPARREGREIPRSSHRPQLLRYSDQVRYVEQLRRYHDLFPPDQVLVLIYDDFRNDNESVVRSVMRFLDVDAERPVAVQDVNPSIMMRSQRLDDLVYLVSVGRGGAITRGARAAVKAVLPRRVRRDALQLTRTRVVHGRPPPTDEAFMLELRHRFKGEVTALSDYLGRDLVSLWGYEDVD